MSDVVPDQYKKSATCTDSQNYELSQAQKREAQQRAAEVKNRAQRDATVTPMPAASSPSGATGELPLPIEKRPRELITDATDCQTQWRIYDESIACFGPYRTARGATKPEGYDYCNVIASPELKCGPPTR